MTPTEIEQAAYELDEVRIVIRASRSEKLGDYAFVRAAAGNASISEWLEQRIIPIAKGHEVVVLDGTGAVPHKRTKMETLRASYSR